MMFWIFLFFLPRSPKTKKKGEHPATAIERLFSYQKNGLTSSSNATQSDNAKPYNNADDDGETDAESRWHPLDPPVSFYCLWDNNFDTRIERYHY
jgi:hypothetical protein